MSAIKARIGIVRFPGSNCDQDCFSALTRHFGIEPQIIWHTESSLPKIDGLIIPGGFSYGDYLRSGALASHSAIMREVKSFTARGGPVIGICNGFQILTESALLPGTLLRNIGRKFVCKYVGLRGQSGATIIHRNLAGKLVKLPVAHGQGRYFCSPDTLRELKDNGQVVVRYTGLDGIDSEVSNFNGSADSIAGICSKNGRVFGLMPHPERATDRLTGGSNDGLLFFHSFLEQCA